MAGGVIMTILMCAFLEISSVEGKEEPHKYTVDELLSLQFENKDSGDLGMDPCKAGE